ncbi:HsdR family type I site-specific deoxyribonuclease [Marinifilum sp. N1E240]|uniref:type I restriction endonuclease subunit R n=1 Tax=Marinifilum sp. N1E240 TaxID=2608082 RepID=UPI00128BAD54|nr:type I restriction endonuclease subunit R [Marinifilum sp. N1E240]MPQ46993.1 HsdR family type I site-specific deoxyribonuclease [Marinifilum sp. N1E240]
MTTEPEQILEDNLLTQLISLGYEKAIIKDETDLLSNLKTQLEKHNKISLSENDFKQILNFISKGNVFEKAKILRDRVPFVNDKGEDKTIELINQTHWCKNEFQVTQQVSMEGKYKNRYDVTILINGLPLVQIELKRRGIELKEAFNQINRYKRHSFASGNALFQYVQIFGISNGVNTKYYANNSIKKLNYKQTFFWADEKNKLITQLSKFADVFLEPCHIAKMITRYVVLNESFRALMVLRPYQYYATEAIVETVEKRSGNGYIWHTTGSGKTLTSFKASQIITRIPKVHKVVFVVDRKDLDYQTTKEFNSFSKGSIDGTNNTKALVDQFADTNIKLIVTTIQKLNTAISKNRYNGTMEQLQDKRMVFIFDECHRSQFGDTHQRIVTYFKNIQLFGFTGTPIFEKNSLTKKSVKKTTKSLFNKCLHKYVITDAIKDENVLKFSIEYIRTFKRKDTKHGVSDVDIEVEDIDRAEVMDAPERLDKITEYIIANHHRKTHNKEYTSIFCVSSIDTLIEYYNILHLKKEKNKHNLKVATIFSYQANEEDRDAIGSFEDEEFLTAAEPKTSYSTDATLRVSNTTVADQTKYRHSREYLDEFIGHYNKEFGTNYTTKDSQSFYNYYNDIARRVKNKQIDVLLVVNMFLTGFDSKALNTIYVDKNLKYHGLIQAYSRTNRILDERKSQGNVVCFRNLKYATDEAIKLFSNIDAKEDIIIKPYEEYVAKFNEAFIELIQIAPTVNSVNSLQTEEDEMAFVKAFRELMRLKNVLSTFTEFTFEDLAMPEQGFEDYKSKYLDLFDKVRSNNLKEKVSILQDIDFELELIHRDEINVAYILRLLADLKDKKPEEQEKEKQRIVDIIAGDTQLRSKKELIERFILENLPHIEDADDISDEFEVYVNKERIKAIKAMSEEENLDSNKLERLIGDYLFTEKQPLRDDVISMMNNRPALKERRSTAERITSKIVKFVETFISGIAG